MISFINLSKKFVNSSFIRNSSHHVTRKSTPFDKKPTLFGDEASPPVRFVMMTASALNFEYKLHSVDIFCGENKTDFYTKINPLQKVPTLAVGDHIINDSHAIALYLCRRSRNNFLYPDSPEITSKIDQMLFYNAGTLFPIDCTIFSEYFTGKWPVDESKEKEWHTALDYLEHRLNKSSWLAGDKLSLCDLCCGATVGSLQLLVPILDRHRKVQHWMKRLQEVPYYKVSDEGLKRLTILVEKVKSIL